MKANIDIVLIRYFNDKIEILLENNNGKYNIPSGCIEDFQSINNGIINLTEKKFNKSPYLKEQLSFEASNKTNKGGWNISLPYLCFIKDIHNLNNNDFEWIDVKKIIIEKIDLNKLQEKSENKIGLFQNQNKIVTNLLVFLKDKLRTTSIATHILQSNFAVVDIINFYEYFNLKISKQTVKNRFISNQLITEKEEKRKYQQGKPATTYILNKKYIKIFNTKIG